jgi:hypothetical protein
LNLSVRTGIIGTITGLFIMLKSREVRIPGITGTDADVLAAYFEAATPLTYCSSIPFYL